VPGVGKCYVRFETVEDAQCARKKLGNRRFNGKALDITYYQEEKFVKNYFT
jgi:hypothetical protein